MSIFSVKKHENDLTHRVHKLHNKVTQIQQYKNTHKEYHETLVTKSKK